jgi:HD-GYP domain-containing protein (c-di-GMP phosphodiesterase class II)
MSKISNLGDSEMTNVPKELFTDGIPLPAEVYTRLDQGKFVLIGKKDDISNLSKLHAVQENKASLFVRNADYPAVLNYNLQIIDKAINNESVSPVLKLNLIKGVTESVLSDLARNDLYIGSFDRCKQISGFIKDTVAQIKDFDKFIDIMSALEGDVVTKSIATSVISLSMCHQMGITMKTTLEKVVMGAFLRDVGLKEIPNSILMKPRHLRDEAEVQYYESHPLRGVEILRRMKEVPADVLAIVLEHHENAMGLGYPRRIRDMKMNPLARIVALADIFVEMLYEPMDDGSRRTPEEVVNYIENTLGQPYNKPAFIALKTIIHVTHIQKKIRAFG